MNFNFKHKIIFIILAEFLLIIFPILLSAHPAQAQTAGSVEPINPSTSQKIGCQNQSSPLVYCKKWLSFTCINIDANTKIGSCRINYLNGAGTIVSSSETDYSQLAGGCYDNYDCGEISCDATQACAVSFYTEQEKKQRQTDIAKTKTAMADTSTPFNLLNPLENLEVKIPGLNTSTQVATCTTLDGNTNCSIPWIAVYIKGIFNFSMGILGFLAGIALMIGGVIWLVAAGNASRISEAKTWIGASITGLIIGLTSYMLLNEVSPSLIGFKPLLIQAVREEKVFMDSAAYEAYTGEPVTAAFDQKMIDTIKAIGKQYDISPCWYIANLKFESGGLVNAIGPDVNVTVNNSTTNYKGYCAIISRRKFLYEKGVITKNQAFYQGDGYGCDASTETLPFDKNNPDSLDPNYSWGLGLSQYTIFPDQAHDPDGFFGAGALGHTVYCNTTDGKRGFEVPPNNDCIGIAEALTLTGNLKIMSAMTKVSWGWCPGIHYDGSGFTPYCFTKYGNLDTSFKTDLYNECLKNGVDSYVQ